MLVDKSNTLGLKGNINEKIKNASFVGVCEIWQKDHALPEPKVGPQYHINSFHKYGKTLGILTKRYVEYLNGVLFYYDDEKDQRYKRYCNLENLYMQFLRTDQSFVLYLTNGREYIQMYFEKSSFLKDLQKSFFRYVIQLNFKEKYALKHKIGKGSFSSVYIAEHRKRKTKVAVKFISKKDQHGVQTRSLVEEEKRIMVRANSPYLCEMMQFFEDEENYILVLEYLPGKDLLCVLRKNPNMSLNILLKIMRECMEGLKCLHKLKIIHRDIKPQNIMINEEDYSAKIIDFGLSLTLKPNLQKKAFSRCGTMGFMAHQVISNTPLNRQPYDQKCDIFSMGIILHIMLTGSNPLRGKDYEETCRNNSENNLKVQKEFVVKTYGEEALELIEGMLEKDPKKRMSAEDVLKSPFLQEKQNKQQIITERISEYQLENQQNQEQKILEAPSPLLSKSKI